MKFEELKKEFPKIGSTWNSKHEPKSDSTADAEIWHTPMLCNGIPFAHCIRELVYGDGKAKLSVKYSSWTREKYDALKDVDDFMGDIARGLTKYYPDLDYILAVDWVDLEPNTPAMDKFAEIYEHILSNPELNSNAKPIIKDVDDEGGNENGEEE